MNTPIVAVKAKGWLTSKTNWVGFLTAVAGASQLVDVVALPHPWNQILLTAAGIATVLLRSFGTNAPVAASPIASQAAYVEAAPPVPSDAIRRRS